MSRSTDYAVSPIEANRTRAARGWESFRAWGRANRAAAYMHREAAKPMKVGRERASNLIELAESLDREYDRYIKYNL